MKRRAALGCGAVFLVFLSRALFIPPTLEDIDSVNFALALDTFDPREHQPHPPGYPVYIALARVAYAAIPNKPHALALLSAAAQAVLVLPLFALMKRLSASEAEAAVATFVALVSPLVWFNGARPMSDSVGLLFVVTAQALLLGGSLTWGSLVAGLSLGVRLQAGLLTLPLWAFAMVRARRGRGLPIASLVGGVLIWSAPLVALSGGIQEYLGVFGRTLGDALPAEPLVTRLTVNRAAKTLFEALTSPWGSPVLGVIMSVVSGTGFLVLMRRDRRRLGLTLLCFVPYFLAHLLFQQVSVLRYGLPYAPFLAWLAVAALRKPLFQWIGAGAIAVISGLLTLPALFEYTSRPSPPYAAFQAIQSQAVPPEAYVLTGHYMFHRYFSERPPGVQFIAPSPRKELEGLRSFWLSGGTKKVLFVAHPDRTDLEMVAPSARRLVGRWEYGPAVRRFLSGARPIRAELVAIDRPAWFSGPGFMISDEAGSIADVTAVKERKAFLLPLDAPSFLLVSGDPLSENAKDYDVVFRLSGSTIDKAGLGAPLLRKYPLALARASLPYEELLAVSDRPGAPFLFKGLDYGVEESTGFVHGEGWFLPERDEDLMLFRWVSPRARTLVHVPAGGAALGIEGVAPLEYYGAGIKIEVLVDGKARASTTLGERPFRVEASLEKGDWQVELTADRHFVPDRIQHNGDRRALSLRVYRYDVSRAKDARR